MTVTYNPDAAGPATVTMAGAEDDIADGPHQLHGSSSSLVQEEAIVDGTYPLRLPRGNRVYEFTFTVRKKHASYEASVAYWLGHLDDFPGVGVVTFTQGSAVLTVSTADVKVDGFPNGATSEWTYQVRGIVT